MKKNVILINYGQLVFEAPDCCMNIRVGDLVTLREYLFGGTATFCTQHIYM